MAIEWGKRGIRVIALPRIKRVLRVHHACSVEIRILNRACHLPPIAVFQVDDAFGAIVKRSDLGPEVLVPREFIGSYTVRPLRCRACCTVQRKSRRGARTYRVVNFATPPNSVAAIMQDFASGRIQ